jgi:hypothetical protein
MPTFGNTLTTDTDIATMDTDRIRGQLGTPADGDGVADSITVRIKADSAITRNAKCALYLHSTGALIGQTDQQAINLTTSYQPFTFTFSTKPNVTNGTVYVIVVFLDYNTTTARLGASDNSGTTDHYYDTAYNGFPSSVTFNHYSENIEIYCTYTVGGGGVTVKKGSVLPVTMTSLINQGVLFSG